MATQHPDRESIVSRASEIESAKDRDAYIAQACGEDDDLRRQVKEQVEEQMQTVEGSSQVEEGKRPPTGRNSRPHPPGHTESREQPLTRIGRYKVLKLLAEGGTGTLYRAEQQEPTRRPVALRLFREGLDWRQIRGRLEVEGETLALLDHPNVARLLDAGVQPSGQPYVVTEWVEGKPITQYCDEQKLGLAKRLELFIAVCRGVQYAHQKGVLHGDLEPSKVLVTNQEDKPVVRVVDFGVARAAGRKPPSNASASEPGEWNGKVEYLSPEQADANTRDIDARSDVYGLGILLYELLTGTTPVKADRVKDLPARKALQLVREEEIPPLSKRVEELGDNASSVAEQRQTQPKGLAKSLHGELDCVVMKALEKNPARRYETVGALARDLERHLANEPIEACPPGLRERLWKMARKHSRLAALTALTLLLLVSGAVAGTGLAIWAFHKESQAQNAEKEAQEEQKKAEKAESQAKGKLQQVEEQQKATARERDQARQAERELRRSEEDTKAVLHFIKDHLLSAGRPSDAPLTESFWSGVQNQARDISLRKAVDAAAAKAGEVFPDRPLAEAGAREILGLAYLNLGEAKLAVPQYERALALREAMQGVNDSATSDCRNRLAVAYRLAGRTTEAARLFDQNLQDPSHAAALSVQGTMLLREKKPVEAELKLRASLTLREKIQPDEWTTYETKSLLGQALLEQKRFNEAETLLVSGYEGMKQREEHIPSSEKSRLRQALERVVQFYESRGQTEQASSWRKKLEAGKETSNP